MKIWWRLRFWNNPAVSNYPGHLVKKTGVRTLTVLHNHDNRESPSLDKHGVNRDLDKKHWCLPYHLTQSSMGAGTLNLGDSVFFFFLHRQPLPHGYTLESDSTLWSRLSIVLEQRNRTRVLFRPFRTILCLNHETLICTYVHRIINGSWVI